MNCYSYCAVNIGYDYKLQINLTLIIIAIPIWDFFINYLQEFKIIRLKLKVTQQNHLILKYLKQKSLLLRLSYDYYKKIKNLII